jgi:hypothetical protein
MAESALGGDHRWFLFGLRSSVRLLFNLLGLLNCGGRSTALWVARAFSVDALPHQFSDRLINRAGMRLLFGDANLRQHFYDHVRWNLQLPR